VTDYCDPADLYAHGLPRGSVPNPGRLIADVDATANTFTLDQHGFALDDPLSFRAELGGTLPAPLVSNTGYFAIPVTDDVFSVAATAGGTAIDTTTAGVNFIVNAPLPIASAITWATHVIDDMLPAHIVPLAIDAIPEIVRMTCAELAAGKLAARAGAQSKSLTEIVDAAGKRLARWAKGVPIRGAVVPKPANLAASAKTTAAFRDQRGWKRFGCL
jgi:hypothetical protein